LYDPIEQITVPVSILTVPLVFSRTELLAGCVNAAASVVGPYPADRPSNAKRLRADEQAKSPWLSTTLRDRTRSGKICFSHLALLNFNCIHVSCGKLCA